ncbi:DUF1223 domain-containing protein [Burkholderia sp. 3C]
MLLRLPLALCTGSVVLASPHGFAAAPRPVVVKPYTSQGCSSCPPADRFLSELSDTPVDVLPLAFHVTYRNQLGWKDPYSLDVATDRQARYARLESAQTPKLVRAGNKVANSPVHHRYEFFLQ